MKPREDVQLDSKGRLRVPTGGTRGKEEEMMGKYQVSGNFSAKDLSEETQMMKLKAREALQMTGGGQTKILGEDNGRQGG